MTLAIRLKNVTRLLVPCCASILTLCLIGCRSDDGEFEIVTFEGRIEEIRSQDGQTGSITIRYWSDKHGQDLIGSGLVTSETEILINGAVAKLDEVKVGEHIRSKVRIEKKNKQQRQVAMQILVDRAKPVGEGNS